MNGIIKYKHMLDIRLITIKCYKNYFQCFQKKTFHKTVPLKNKQSSIMPLLYENVIIEKSLILNNNKGKTGVYRWTNLVNSKTYIGSANNLTIRFWVYFSINRLTSSNMTIYKAILKYGYENFKLEILEYCNPDIVLSREQYYIDLYKPEYNKLSIAGSTLGYKHTAETLEKFNTRKFSDKALINLAKAATGRILSEQTKAKISNARKGIKLSNETRNKLSIILGKRYGVSVEVTNIISGEIKQYTTLTIAASTLGVTRTAVKKAMVSCRLLKKIYIVKPIYKKN